MKLGKSCAGFERSVIPTSSQTGSWLRQDPGRDRPPNVRIGSLLDEMAGEVRQELKMFLNAGLLQYRIGGVPGLDRTVDYETSICDWTVPDLMVASALSFTVTPIGRQDLLDL